LEEEEESSPGILDKVNGILAPARNDKGEFAKDTTARIQPRAADGKFAKNGGNPYQHRNKDGKFGKNGPHLYQPRNSKGQFSKIAQYLFQTRDKKGRFGKVLGAGLNGYLAACDKFKAAIKAWRDAKGLVGKKTAAAEARTASAAAVKILDAAKVPRKFVHFAFSNDYRWPIPKLDKKAGGKPGGKPAGKKF